GAMGWGIASRFARFALTMVSSVLIVRSLGPSEYGRLAILRMALAFLGAFLSFGLGQAVLRYVPVARAEGSRKVPASVLTVAMVLPTLGVLLASGAAVLLRRTAWPGLGAGSGDLVALGVALLVFELILATLTYAASAFYDARALLANALLGNA